MQAPSAPTTQRAGTSHVTPGTAGSVVGVLQHIGSRCTSETPSSPLAHATRAVTWCGRHVCESLVGYLDLHDVSGLQVCLRGSHEQRGILCHFLIMHHDITHHVIRYTLQYL